jgi:hypothetical protein
MQLDTYNYDSTPPKVVLENAINFKDSLFYHPLNIHKISWGREKNAIDNHFSPNQRQFCWGPIVQLMLDLF